jgi:hypothetical protein
MIVKTIYNEEIEYAENGSNNLAIHALTCHHLAAFR